tara:strand:+ start:84 stop:290 length:207 start_codon:yes stop_codon:yes gene_type:complete
MSELLESLFTKSYDDQVKALKELSEDKNNEIGFIEIDGKEYRIPSKVIYLIDMLYVENEKLKRKKDGL